MSKSPARVLRSKGLIPRDWNLRQLTPSQKGYVTKQSKKFAQVLKRPGDYVSRKAAPSTLKKLKLADYPVAHGRVLLHVPGKDRVSIARGQVTFKRARQTERVLLQSSPDFLAELEQLGNLKRRLPKGHFVGFKIGNSQVIGTFHSVADAYQYATTTRGFSGKDADNVALVLIDATQGYEYDEDDE